MTLQNRWENRASIVLCYKKTLLVDSCINQYIPKPSFTILSRSNRDTVRTKRTHGGYPTSNPMEGFVRTSRATIETTAPVANYDDDTRSLRSWRRRGEADERGRAVRFSGQQQQQQQHVFVVTERCLWWLRETKRNHRSGISLSPARRSNPDQTTRCGRFYR